MNIDELITLMKHNKQYNFLAIAITPLHVVGICAFLQMCKSKGESIEGLILIKKHDKTGIHISANNFVLPDYNIQFVDFDFSYTKKKGLINKITRKIKNIRYCKKQFNDNIYVVWIDDPIELLSVLREADYKKNMHFVKIDDGGATYDDYYLFRLRDVNYGIGNNIVKKMFNILKIRLYVEIMYIFHNIFVRKNNFTNFTIFEKKRINPKLGLIRSPNIAKWYVDIFEKQGSNIDYSLIKKLEGCILLNTQAFQEACITNGIADLTVIGKAIEIFNKLGFSVILKPHPRETDIERYKQFPCIILNLSYPQESIIARLKEKPKCIVSVDSSTLMNVYGLFGIKAISLAMILSEEKISDIFRNDLIDYYNQYNEFILFPKSYKELESIISSII